MKLSIVIPCYRSSLTIKDVVEECMALLQSLEFDYEFILINDYSPDDTYQVLCKMAATNKNIKVVDLAKNFGQHGALMAGFQFVTGDTVVCMDDDGQAPVESLPEMLATLATGYELVIAEYKKKNHSMIRSIESRLNLWVMRCLLNIPKGLVLNSFFVCRRFIVEEMKKYKNPYPMIGGLLLCSTSRIANVLVEHRARSAGESNYNFKKLFSLWLNGFTAFSVKPLRVASCVGFFVAGIGFLYGGQIVLQKIIHPLQGVDGWVSLMATILFIGGIIMMLLGLLGEYVGRIYISINNLPQYVIRQVMNIEDEN